MKVLLDTHAFIWFISGDKQLPSRVMEIISNPKNDCFLSIAGIWEIAIKMSLGKIELLAGFDKITVFLLANSIEVLPVTFVHLQTLLKLDYCHRDPFDRLIVSQGVSENLSILSKDPAFSDYPIELIWK